MSHDAVRGNGHRSQSWIKALNAGQIAIGCHQVATGVEAEITGPAIRRSGTIREGDLEETFTINGQIGVVARDLYAAGGENTGRSRKFHAGTDLGARGIGPEITGPRSGGNADVVVEVLEIGPLALEARGVDVGDVIGDDIDIGLLGGHAAGAGP